jgi:unsaturated rhamnogalacturonyl hydrolase
MRVSRRSFLYGSSAWTAAFVAVRPMLAQQQQLTDKEKLPAVGDSLDDAGPLATDISARISPEEIRKAMERVGTWELSRTHSSFNDDWTFAALYAGFMAAAKAIPDKKFTDAMLAMGSKLHWQPGPDPLHADHQAVGQTYLELYLKFRDPAMLGPIEHRFDEMMVHPDDPNKPLWWWCDALFMAPPVCTRLYRATGNKKYLAFLDREWWTTSASLYDTQEHLFYRDARFLTRREANGKKVFWSRGNGWVLAGLARVLEYMPEDWPTRPRYIQQFQQMAVRLAALQNPDGLWRSGLLDATDYPLAEISGSGFIAYGIAWGVNHGVLKSQTYKATIENTWKGMVSHIYRDGRLGNIQPVGAAPGQFKPTSSYVYGVGAFLLAGSELLQMISTPAGTSKHPKESSGR